MNSNSSLVRSCPFSIFLSRRMSSFLSANFGRNSIPPGSDLTFSSTIGTSESFRACPSFRPEISATLPSGSRRTEAQALLASLPVFGSMRWKRINLDLSLSSSVFSCWLLLVSLLCAFSSSYSLSSSYSSSS